MSQDDGMDVDSYAGDPVFWLYRRLCEINFDTTGGSGMEPCEEDMTDEFIEIVAQFMEMVTYG